MASLPLSQIEGKYEILAKIKEGGMGAIYKVRHRLLDEIRVVKVMRPQISDSEDLQRRFAREARAAIRLKHPNIAQLYDFAVEPDGIAYMVMEFIDGVTLQEMLAKNGPAPVDLTLEMARQALEALRYLHAHGYVHRDVAPDNLMLTKDFSGQPQVKLIDMGIVKHLAHGAEGLTATGMFLGKVRYSSPEQFSGEKGGVDHRSDLYSFGVMLYELLTGKCPIVGENLSQLVAAHLFQPPLKFEDTDPQGRVPEEIRAVVLRSLVKAPAERFASAQEMQDALARHRKTKDLAKDLEATLATTLEVRLDTIRPPQPGTTQGQLNEHFGMVRTPGPGPGLRAADPVSAESPAEQQAKLLSSAQRLAQERRWEEARLLLYQALALNPDHQEVRALLASVETAHQQAVEEEKRRQAIAQAVARVDACLLEERPDDAVRELEQVRFELGELAEFSGFEAKIADLRAELAERARQREIAAEATRISSLLDDERAELAGAALAAAQQRFGTDGPFPALAKRLADLNQKLEDERREREAAARRERVSALLGEAAELAKREKFVEAVDRAEEALEIEPTDAAARQARDGYRDAEVRRLQEVRRQNALRAAITTIEGLLTREQADDAESELEAAETALGADPRLEKLRGGIERLRRTLEERAREEERRQAEIRRQNALREAVAKIENLLAREQADDAESELQAAETALGADPRLEKLRGGIERLRRTLEERAREEARRQAEIRRQNALREAATKIEGLLAREEADDADRELATAEAALGDDPRLKELRGGLEQLRRTLEERERERVRQAAIVAAVATIASHVESERTDDAQQALTDAMARLGEDARFGELGGRIERLRSELAERERQRVLELRRREEEERRKQEEERREREEKLRREQEERKRKAEEERKKKAAEEERKRKAEEERKRKAEEERKQREAEARRKEEERRLREAAEARRKEEERRQQAEAEARRKEEERQQAEAEARRKEEERRQQAEAEARRQEEERRLREEAEAQRQDEEHRLREAAEARRQDEERRLHEEAEARRLEEDRRRAEEETARRLEEERLGREKAAADRARRLEELLAAATSDLEAGQLDRSLKRLEDARAEYGVDAALEQLTARAQAEIAQRDAEHKRLREINREVAAVMRLLDNGRLDRAEQQLRKASQELGAGEIWTELQTRIDSARRAEAEETRRRAEEEEQRLAAVEDQKRRAAEEEERRRVLSEEEARVLAAEEERRKAARAERKRQAKLQRRTEEARIAAEGQRQRAAAAEAARRLAREQERAEDAKYLAAQEARLEHVALGREPAVAAERRRIKPTHWAAAAGIALLLAIGGWSLIAGRSRSSDASSPAPGATQPESRVAESSGAPERPPAGATGSKAAPARPPVRPAPAARGVNADRTGPASAGAQAPASARPTSLPARPEERAADSRREAAPKEDRSSATERAAEAKADDERTRGRQSESAADSGPRAVPQEPPPPAIQPSPAGQTTRLEVEPVPPPQPTAVPARPAPPPERPADTRPAAAAPAPARQVEPPPPIAPPPPNEREAVLTALGHFRAAYESLDADAVAQVFPGVDLPELRRAFKQYKSMSVQIDTGACQTTIDGDRATATCNVTRVIHPKAGESQSLSQRETFQLRKAQQSWVVEAVR